MNMKSLLFAGLLMILPVSAIFAQEQVANNVFYAEGFGNGGIVSINYEGMIRVNPVFDLSIRFGVSTIPRMENIDFEYHGVGLPMEFNQIFALKDGSASHLEIGEGLFWFFNKKDGDDIIRSIGAFTLRTGYRYQKITGGFFFKASAMIFLYVYDSRITNSGFDHQVLYPWGGIAVGYSF
jgi:hypothetical protein